MTYEEINEELKQLGYPVTYRVYGEGEVPQVPYIVWYVLDSDNFMADGMVYARTDTICIELYTEEKMPDVEQKIENWLDEKQICWNRQEHFIESEKYIEQLYMFSL